ncbi:MAG: hypothetical protein IT370_34395 [Deltaproteobacteria bacterium]|nr:hypothetical protein [Deltaproteobacteria bacterium]
MTPADPGTSSPRQRWLIAIGLTLALTGLVTLLGSRERPWADARIMYEVAEQLGAGKGIAPRTRARQIDHAGRLRPGSRLRALAHLRPASPTGPRHTGAPPSRARASPAAYQNPGRF